MKAEKFIVTTSVRGASRSQIWDASQPLQVGHGRRWVLERKGEAMRLSQRDGKAAYDIANGGMDLPNELKLRIVPARDMSPPYHLPEGRAATPTQSRKLQLFSFSGVGRGITACQPVHTAYVAYVRSQPVFTLYQKDGEFQIKPLLDGVKFKLRRQRAVAGPVGEVWKLTAEQLYGASVIRGSHWWRFNLVPTSVRLEDGPDEEALLAGEGAALKKTLLGFGLAFLAFSVAVWLAPRPSKVTEEPKEEPIVQFIAPKTVQPPPRVVAPVTSKSETIEKVAPEPDPVPVKGVSEQKIKKTAPEKQKPAPPAPDPKVTAQKTAAQKLSMLRAALGGATTLTQKTTARPVKAATSSGLFTGGSAPLSPTEIKPTYASDNSTVGAVGGGYAKGEHASVGGKGTSFVSVDAGGPTVEEGLDKSEVGAVIHKHTDEIRYCHETALLYHPNLEGKLVIQFGIDPNGKVEKASVQSSDLPDPTLEKCILKHLTTWQFPKPKGGVHVNVSYPFVFKTLGGE